MPGGWNSLPLELRWMVREHIRSIIQQWSTTDPPHPQLPLVCREWHSWFKHENFRFLMLDQDRLDDFKRLVSNDESRRDYVEGIILRIKLLDYDCPACDEEEDEHTARINDSIFMDTLQRFMAIVLTWTGREQKHGITLDLGAYSPSDGRHGFRDCRFSQGYRYGASRNVYEQHAAALRRACETDNGKSTCPGWDRICNGEHPMPLMASKKRLLATLGDNRQRHFVEVFTEKHDGHMRLRGIAPAPIINSLVLRRHYYRQISPLVLGCLIRQGLPNLQSFRHEAWRKPDHAGARRFEEEYRAVLDALPRTMDHCSLLCESSALLENTGDFSSLSRPASHWPRHLAAGSDMSLAAVALATRLRSFCATYSLSVEDFLDGASIGGLPDYPRLEHLVLTSKLLQSRVSCHAPEFVDLVVVVGCTAFLSMPKLKNLILWDGDASDGFFMRFSYTANRRPAISWRSTWHAKGDLSPAFAKLRRILRGPPQPHEKKILQIVHEWPRIREEDGLDARFRRRSQDSTQFTELRNLILHPESTRQRMFETTVLETYTPHHAHLFEEADDRMPATPLMFSKHEKTCDGKSLLFRDFSAEQF